MIIPGDLLHYSILFIVSRNCGVVGRHKIGVCISIGKRILVIRLHVEEFILLYLLLEQHLVHCSLLIRLFIPKEVLLSLHSSVLAE